MNEKICENCCFSMAISSATNRLYCKRHAPHVEYVYPRVGKEHWCGDFEKKEK